MSSSLAFFPSREQQTTDFHRRLALHNAPRLVPQFASSDWIEQLKTDHQFLLDEGHFIESERNVACRRASGAPCDPGQFIAWFEDLRDTGPGQQDPLFDWLANDASMEQMRWFLTQEAAGEAGFEDLVALSQLKLAARPKLEMARNYWDEMGRGHERAMHGPLLTQVVEALDLAPSVEETCWQSLALANLMVGLAGNRRYAYQSIGALGVIEMTAPGRVSRVNAGLERLGAPERARTYFALHAGLDVKHSQCWNAEVIGPLVTADSRTAMAIAEGALMRLNAGARCFEVYRLHFGI